MRSDQDFLIERAIKKSAKITCYLKNGVPVRGRVLGHDNHTIYLDTEQSPTLVFKHSISSIFPVRYQTPKR